MKSDRNYKINMNTVRQYIEQNFLYLLEVIGIPFIFAYISTLIVGIDDIIDFINRILIFSTFYQLTIRGILGQIVDIKVDQYNAMIDICEYIELYNKTQDADIYNFIVDRIEYQLESKTFNEEDARKIYSEIKNCLDNHESMNINKINKIKKYYQTRINGVKLDWNYSILLKLAKSNSEPKENVAYIIILIIILSIIVIPFLL